MQAVSDRSCKSRESKQNPEGCFLQVRQFDIFKSVQSSVNRVGQHDWKKKPLYYVVERGKMASTWEATMGLTEP